MAKVFETPDEIEVPKMDFSNFNRDEYEKDVERFFAELRSWISEQGYNDKESGKIISFPIADGHAQYMVIKTKGTPELFYLALDDCWSFPYIQDITSKTIKEKIKQDEAMTKLFS